MSSVGGNENGIDRGLCHPAFSKGSRAFADLRYGKEDSISPSTLIFAAAKGSLGIYTLHILPEIF